MCGVAIAVIIVVGWSKGVEISAMYVISQGWFFMWKKWYQLCGHSIWISGVHIKILGQ